MQEFFDSIDISWQAPGRKDFITIPTVDQEGKKSKQNKQLGYMLMSLKGFFLFYEKYPSVKIG